MPVPISPVSTKGAKGSRLICVQFVFFAILGLALKLDQEFVQILRASTYSSVHALSVDLEFDISKISYLLVSCLSSIALNPSNFTMGDRVLNAAIEVEQFLHVIRKLMDLNKTMLVYLFPPIQFHVPASFLAEHAAAMESVNTFVGRHRRVYVLETFTPSLSHVYQDKAKLKSGGVAKYMESSFASLTIMYNDFLKCDDPVELVISLINSLNQILGYRF